VSRPVIGICGAIERVSWGAWTVLANVSPRSYSLAVEAAGGLPLLLPPDDASAERPAQILDLLDGLMLAGGSDIDPSSYGAQPHPETKGTWPERDRFELALAHAALERDMPVLGICRGMEMLNVACGGTLVQHLPDAIDSHRHRHTPGAFSDHEVRIADGTLTARAVGATSGDVKSHHHQGLGELGEHVMVTAWCVEDNAIEAIELSAKAYAIGVLWHPEEDESSRVIGSLVDAARDYRSAADPAH
jgi:putative glutamine amidotransferase